MTKVALLPCPFCGGDAEIVSRSGYRIIRCGNQNCVVDCHVQHGTIENMAKFWNTRAGYKTENNFPEIDTYDRDGVIMAGVQIAGCMEYKTAQDWISFCENTIHQIATRIKPEQVQ